MKILKTISRLYIPVYVYFIFSIVSVSFFVGFFERYSRIDFSKVAEIIEGNKESINNQISDRLNGDNISQFIKKIADLERELKLSKANGDKDSVERLENEISDLKDNISKTFEDDLNEIGKEALSFIEKLEKVKERVEKRRKTIELENRKESKASLSVEISGKKIDISKNSSVIIRKIREIFDNTEVRIRNRFPGYSRLLGLRKFFIFFILIWLWPVYRFNFGRSGYSKVVESRIMNFTFFSYWLIWVYGFYTFGLRSFYIYRLKGTLIDGNVGIYFISFLIFSSITSFFYLILSEKYLKNKIAYPVFSGKALYSIKKGRSFQITSRIAMFIVSFSILPLVIILYIPIYFNSGVIVEIFKNSSFDIALFFYIIFPVIIMTGIAVFFLIPQFLSIFWFRRSIQGPINRLIERMNMVSKGDFASKASVLTYDEIGKLRGHFNQMVEGLQEREKIRDTFGKFVSLEIAEKLISQGHEMLEGEEIETTVMFTDIRDFTPFSETMSPKELVEFLNSYFSYMCSPIIANKGVINKFIGDSIMAVFSPVFGVEDHADAALRAALGIREALKNFNSEGNYPEIRHGVGIHTGILISGKIGTQDRMEYTVIGDTVNIASRIESQTKVYKDDILISEDLLGKIDRNKFRDIDFYEYEPVLMKGKSRKMVLYGVKDGENGKT